MAIAKSLVNWRNVASTNVAAVGWPKSGSGLPVGAYVRFDDGSMYLYTGVTRQRVIAMSKAESVGKYLNRVIKPRYPVSRVA